MSTTSDQSFDRGAAPFAAPFAEFPSENEIEFEGLPARRPDDLELFAPENFVARPRRIRGSGLFGSPVVAGIAVSALVVAALAGLTLGERVSPTGERPGSGDPTRPVISPVPSTPVVSRGSAAVMPAFESVPSRTGTQVTQVSDNSDRAASLLRVRTRISAKSSSVSRAEEVDALPGRAPAWASTPVPASPPMNQPMPMPSVPADVQVAAVASDPDGDSLTYRWSAPTGRFANALERETVFTCPDTPTSVALTVTVTDGRGGVANDTLLVDCVAQR